MSFNNLYYKRTAGTAKACYVCYKPTTTVLATINTVDFLYTCVGHLSDSAFATLVKDETKSGSPAISAEEIAKVKADWEEKQKKKEEKEKSAKDSEKEKDKNKEEEQDKSKDKETKEKTKSASAPGSGTPTPTHERYILHRDFFTMRQAEHRRQRQAAQAKEIGIRLPSAPSGNV